MSEGKKTNPNCTLILNLALINRNLFRSQYSRAAAEKEREDKARLGLGFQLFWCVNSRIRFLNAVCFVLFCFVFRNSISLSKEREKKERDSRFLQARVDGSFWKIFYRGIY